MPGSSVTPTLLLATLVAGLTRGEFSPQTVDADSSPVLCCPLLVGLLPDLGVPISVFLPYRVFTPIQQPGGLLSPLPPSSCLETAPRAGGSSPWFPVAPLCSPRPQVPQSQASAPSVGTSPPGMGTQVRASMTLDKQVSEATRKVRCAVLGGTK